MIEQRVREPVQKRGIEKKTKIIQATRRLINEIGYDAVTTHKIAVEAGVSVGTIYSYFKDKRDILMEVVADLSESTYENLKGVLNDVIEKTDTLEDAFRMIIKKHWEGHSNDRQLHRDIIIQSLKDREIYEKTIAKNHDYRLILEEILKKYKNQIDIEDKELAGFLPLMVVNEMVHYLMHYGSPIPVKRILDGLTKMVSRYLKKK